MGGKNPAVVLDDAENLDRVAAHIVNGAFWNMGGELLRLLAPDRAEGGEGCASETHPSPPSARSSEAGSRPCSRGAVDDMKTATVEVFGIVEDYGEIYLPPISGDFLRLAPARSGGRFRWSGEGTYVHVAADSSPTSGR